MARDYSNIGQILKDKGDLDEALKYGKMALEIDGVKRSFSNGYRLF